MQLEAAKVDLMLARYATGHLDLKTLSVEAIRKLVVDIEVGQSRLEVLGSWPRAVELLYDLDQEITRRLGDGKAKLRRKPHQILADDMRNPKNWVEQLTGLPVPGGASIPIQDYDCVVLDDDALRMAMDLSLRPVKDMLRMLDVAVPTSSLMWIEWSATAYLEHCKQAAIRQGHSTKPFDHVRPEGSKVGAMIMRSEGRMSVRCIEHAETLPRLTMWPVYFEISLNGQPIEPIRHAEDNFAEFEIKKGQMARELQVRKIWGYGTDDPDILKLDKRALALIPAEYQSIRHNAEWVNRCTDNLQGFVRHVVAILALLTTTTTHEPAVRPKGHHITKGGKTVPYVARRYAQLVVPRRIRNRTGYVMQQVKEASDRARHRLHHVIGHFRHLDHRPENGEGWLPCFCEGREPGRYWHRHISSHWRGDESLGVIEHDFTLIKGRKPDAH